MYMAGRLRTASSPSSTLILSAPYSSAPLTGAVPAGSEAGSIPSTGMGDSGCSCSMSFSTTDPVRNGPRSGANGVARLSAGQLGPDARSQTHGHDHIQVVVLLGTDRSHQ